ncbi:hypothetical protein [Nostoc commune]|uniref:hypothetical protein n=1 Tax=Nostoc commune TaxID=1178 RepID=UPI0020733D43|nr:hypothetical protein [Nostoc commune]
MRLLTAPLALLMQLAQAIAPRLKGVPTEDICLISKWKLLIISWIVGFQPLQS